MAILPEQLRKLLTPEGIKAAFELLGAELEQRLDLAPVLRVLDQHGGSPDLEARVARAFDQLAVPWSETVAAELGKLTPLVAAAIVSGMLDAYALDGTNAIGDVAAIVGLALRGVAVQTRASTPRVGARIAAGVVGLGTDDSLMREGYVRGRVRQQARAIGAAYLGRARAAGIAAVASATGVSAVRFEAVMDAHTTEICSFLHGRVFTIDAIVTALEKVADASEAKALSALPWARRVGDKLVVDRDQDQLVIATVLGQPGEGTPLQFLDGLGTDDLEAEGIVLPPLHHECRSTIVPEAA